MRWAKRIAITIMILLAAFAGLRIYIKKKLERSTFVLNKERSTAIDSALKSGIQRISFRNKENILYTNWLFNNENSPSIFILHGNSETISDWVRTQILLKELGYNSFAFDYSGFGSSTGKPSIKTLETDTKAAWKFFDEIAPSSTSRIAFAHSLGTAVLINNCNDISPAPSRMILHGTFSSAKDMTVHLKKINKEWTWILPDLWNNKKRIRTCKLPVCIIHSRSDELTPYTMSEQVAKNCTQCKLLLLDGYHHNDLYRKPDSALWMRLLNCQ